MRLLVTGFGPFGACSDNPSARIACALAAGGPPGGWTAVDALVLPVSYGRAPALLAGRLAETRPDALIAFGLAAGASTIRLERVAGNLCGPTPDIDGVVPPGGRVRPGGPERRRSTLPEAAILAALAAAGFPAAPSEDAGGYLCNALLFEALGWAEGRAPGMPAGFVHVPPADAPGWSPDRLLAAGRIIAQATGDALAPAAATPLRASDEAPSHDARGGGGHGRPG